MKEESIIKGSPAGLPVTLYFAPDGPLLQGQKSCRENDLFGQRGGEL